MSATSVTGKGNGSSDGLNKGPGNKRTIYQPANGAAILAAGEVWDYDEVWQLEVRIPGINENPDDVTVLITQSDWTNYDGRGNNPPHIEKIDSNGNNFDDSDYTYDDSGDETTYKWEQGVTFGGFILHTGDDGGTDSDYPRKFAYVVLKTGGGKNFNTY
jgi:hypothetical protein